MNQRVRSLPYVMLEDWRAAVERLAKAFNGRRTRFGRSKLRVAAVVLIAGAVLAPTMFAEQSPSHVFFPGFIPGTLAVSRVQYDGNTFGSAETFPDIFNDPNITGIQGSIFIDEYLPLPLP